ncbi:MAG: hypothetical protein WDN69_30235 [Aliidongia sp.]
MKIGAKDADAYLAEWRKSAPEPCGDDLAAIAAGGDQAGDCALRETSV